METKRSIAQSNNLHETRSSHPDGSLSSVGGSYGFIQDVIARWMARCEAHKKCDVNSVFAKIDHSNSLDYNMIGRVFKVVDLE